MDFEKNNKMFCGTVESGFNDEFCLVRPCSKPDVLVLIKTSDYSVDTHVAIKNVRKHRVSIKDILLAYALEATVESVKECADTTRLPSEKYFLKPAHSNGCTDDLIEYLLISKGFVVGQLDSSRHTNLYHLRTSSHTLKVIMTDATLIDRSSIIALNPQCHLLDNNFYRISSKADFILLKPLTHLKPFRIVPPSQEVHISTLYSRGYKTGDHQLSECFVVGEYLHRTESAADVTMRSSEVSMLMLGDLKGIAIMTLVLMEGLDLVLTLPTEESGLLRTRVYIWNAVLRVDELGIHTIFHTPSTTPGAAVHLEYWPAVEYTLRIPFEWLSTYYAAESDFEGSLKRVIKFQFLPIKKDKDAYHGVDRKGAQAVVQASNQSSELELGKWYLAVGQVIRLPAHSHQGLLRILLARYKLADPLQDRKVLLKMFSPILSHTNLTNAYI